MNPRFRLNPEAAGQGMTSQRARDRMVERLRNRQPDDVVTGRMLNVLG